ncbi:LysE family translocator [Streptomyces chattanoogensis]|uniref:LysE family translocator n=1 Tax=Streptomyces chattanoogensis TaxID=66876 RepID=UPI0005DA65F1|nr:hypothetical protein T261_2134 [Streptomyces lydicus]
MAYLSLIMFVIATCGTPGPNNNMIMSSGVSHGFRRSIPHVVGINIGFPVMVIAIGFGLDGILKDYPVIYDILRPVGAAYLLYLAYRIAVSPVGEQKEAEAKPLTFLQSALFQWVNPKSWVMAVGAVTTYATGAGGDAVWNIVAVSVIFLVFGTPCTVSWLAIGVALKRVLSKPLQFRIFNVAMAVLLAVSLIPVLGEIIADLQKITS